MRLHLNIYTLYWLQNIVAHMGLTIGIMLHLCTLDCISFLFAAGYSSSVDYGSVKYHVVWVPAICETAPLSPCCSLLQRRTAGVFEQTVFRFQLLRLVQCRKKLLKFVFPIDSRDSTSVSLQGMVCNSAVFLGFCLSDSGQDVLVFNFVFNFRG